MTEKYDITDYLKDDKELQKAVIEELLKENAELNTENARLIEERNMYKTFYRAKHNDINGIFFRYKTCLQKIKEIAECVIDNDNSLKTDHCFGYCGECSSFEHCKLYPYWQIRQSYTSRKRGRMNSKLEKEGVYKYLKKRFWEYTCKARQWYKYFDNFGDLKFVELPIRVLKDSCGLSKFRQSKILDELVSENKIIVKIGQCKIRYYSIVKESEG